VVKKAMTHIGTAAFLVNVGEVKIFHLTLDGEEATNEQDLEFTTLMQVVMNRGPGVVLK
jgi:hypothetical protein